MFLFSQGPLRQGLPGQQVPPSPHGEGRQVQGLLPAGGVPRDQTEVQEEVAQGLLRGQDGKVQAGVSFLLNLQRKFPGSDGCFFCYVVRQEDGGGGQATRGRGGRGGGRLEQ